MITIQCPECHLDNSADAYLCEACGHRFKGAPTTPLGPGATAPATVARAVAATAEPTPAVAAAVEDLGSNLLAPDTLLAGRYRITQLLGQGGMGAVYLAADTRFSAKICVIKEMLDHFNDPEQRAQATEGFNREADFLAELKHSGIPEVYDRFTEANRHYLVMEYINGVDLEQKLLDNGQPFTEQEVIAWAIQCCDVLSYLHHQKPPIIYRDMKPANVITTTWGKVSLVDFGIARFFNPVSRGTMIGTQGYAPPEQYRGQVEPRSDLYALGASLHYLLTGRDPQNEAPFSFPPVRTLNEGVSEAMEALILKALDPEVENRFASADDMLYHLTRLADENCQVIRDCPHCGEPSTITREFCPSCKQYISKKHWAIAKQGGTGRIDAAGQHAVKAPRQAATQSPTPSPSTQRMSPQPTGRTEFKLVPVRKLVLAGLAGLVLLGAAGAAGWVALRPAEGAGAALLSSGERVLGAPQPDKEAGCRAYARGDYRAALAAFTRAIAAEPSDGEARIYAANAALRLAHSPTLSLALAGPFGPGEDPAGAEALRGAAIAQEEANREGGAAKIALRLAADHGRPELAQDAARALTEDDALAGVVGPLSAETSWAALPLYNLAGLPVVLPTATSRQLAGIAGSLVRLSPDDALLGKALADHAAGPLHAKRATVLAPAEDPHQAGFAMAFTREAEAKGLTVASVSFPAHGRADWGAIAKVVAAGKPDAVLFAGSGPDAVAFAKARPAAGLTGPWLADQGAASRALAGAGPGGEGLLAATVFPPEGPGAFAERYEGKFGHPPEAAAALTYEAVTLYAKGRSESGADREALAGYLRAVRKGGFTGLTGPARLDPDGNVRRPVTLLSLRGGRFAPVASWTL